MPDKITIQDFKPEHLQNLHIQDMQNSTDITLDNEYGEVLEGASLFSYSLINETTGETLAVAGVLLVEDYNGNHGRCVAWTLLGKYIGKYMLKLHRAVLRALDTLTVDRIECMVDKEFTEGIKWAEMLGFEYEGCMKKYRLGRDNLLYARIN